MISATLSHAKFVLALFGGLTLLKRVLHRRKARKRVLGVIPARYASSRFPGKPLALIAGKPMIQRTWERACAATSLCDVVVATDDNRIAECCRGFGARVVMTAVDCPNGTARCCEAKNALGGAYDVVVNIQGDEPLMEPEAIDAVVNALRAAPEAVYSTACTPLRHDEVPLRQRVKCVTDRAGYALYFSRGVLPANKDGEVRDYPPPFQRVPYLLHLGLQCFDAAFLDVYAALPSTPLMLMEDLEQLKVLEHGYRIKVVTVDHCAFGVDVPDDVPAIEQRMRELGIA